MLKKLDIVKLKNINGGKIVKLTVPGGKGVLYDYKVINNITGETYGPYKDESIANEVDKKVNNEASVNFYV